MGKNVDSLILEELTKHPEGESFGQLSRALKSKVTFVHVNKHLQALVRQSQVRKEGGGKPGKRSRYWMTKQSNEYQAFRRGILTELILHVRELESWRRDLTEYRERIKEDQGAAPTYKEASDAKLSAAFTGIRNDLMRYGLDYQLLRAVEPNELLTLVVEREFLDFLEELFREVSKSWITTHDQVEIVRRALLSGEILLPANVLSSDMPVGKESALESLGETVLEVTEDREAASLEADLFLLRNNDEVMNGLRMRVQLALRHD